jgi:thiol:disulfide interchange protein DsbD
MTRSLPLVVVLALVLAAPAAAQGDLPPLPGLGGGKSFAEMADLKAKVVPEKAKRGEIVTYQITVTPKRGARTYPINPSNPTQASRNVFKLPVAANKGTKVEDVILIPTGLVSDPLNFEWDSHAGVAAPEQVSYKAVTWEVKAVVSPKATPGKKTIKLDLDSSILACDENNCFYATPESLPTVEFMVDEGDPLPIPPDLQEVVNKATTLPVPPAPKGVGQPRSTPENGSTTPAAPAGPGAGAPAPRTQKVAKDVDQYRQELADVRKGLDKSGVTDETKNSGIWSFVLTAALWGLISLVTPCVFPMIPITVSIFLKQAHGSLGERLKLAGVYCLTIITVLGLSAFALLKFMAWLSVHPLTNLFLGGLFMVLALSLFGMYELTLPNFMARRLQAKQAKGGAIGTVFGALAFTVISFTCVAPFLGGFAGISAADSGGGMIAVPTTKEVLGGLAFATAFAAPFFVLALIPGLLKALPKSGGWLDSVKVVMAFLEVAAALKFFRTAELGVISPPEYFTYDVVLAGWVAISAACGLYLFNVYRLPHDEERPSIGVMRLLFALAFLGLAVYLLPAVFKGPDGKAQRPSGAVFAWVDAFLLPDPGRGSETEWGTDLKEALDRSRKDGSSKVSPRPVFIDFTGVTCTNCNYNESNVFPQPAVKAELEKFERVRLYTDWLPANLYAADPGDRERRLEGLANDAFKRDVFGTQQLPLYVVLQPRVSGGSVVLGVYPEGKINDPAAFVKFLKDAQEKAARK